MSNDLLHAIIEPRDIADLNRVIKSQDRRFTALVDNARLHPARDLRGLDLGPIRIGPEEEVAGYDFSGCLMRGAVLCGVDLRRARFGNCDLSGSDLRGARYSQEQMQTARRDGCLTGEWPERSEESRQFDMLHPITATVRRALRAAGNDVDALEHFASLCIVEDYYSIGEFRYEVAETLYAIALDWRAEHDGLECTATLVNHLNMIISILNQGRVDEAKMSFRGLLPIYELIKGVEHPDVLVMRYRFAQAILDQGRITEAGLLLDALADLRGVYDIEPEHRANFALQRARVANAVGRSYESAAFLDEAEEHISKTYRPHHYVWRMIDSYRDTHHISKGMAEVAKRA